MPKLPRFFDGVDVKPAILHGDLWGGNASENSEGPGKSLLDYNFI